MYEYTRTRFERILTSSWYVPFFSRSLSCAVLRVCMMNSCSFEKPPDTTLFSSY